MDEGKRKLRRYPPETRTEAVRLVLDEYVSPEEVAERFAMPTGTVSAWASEERSLRRRAAAALRKQAEEATSAEAAPDVKYQEAMANFEHMTARNAVLLIALNQIRDIIESSFTALSE